MHMRPERSSSHLHCIAPLSTHTRALTHNGNDANEEIILSTCNTEFSVFFFFFIFLNGFRSRVVSRYVARVFAPLSCPFEFLAICVLACFSIQCAHTHRKKELIQKRMFQCREKERKKAWKKMLDTWNVKRARYFSKTNNYNNSTRLYCYFGICWFVSAGKCLFYV